MTRDEPRKLLTAIRNHLLTDTPDSTAFMLSELNNDELERLAEAAEELAGFTRRYLAKRQSQALMAAMAANRCSCPVCGGVE
jgi:hypothetical protein